ncbi:MAG: 4-(cytidine 5'-diphospho)-2-C-methyl-D-erythritol kinase [Planctomycetota bacterium]|jgi:4-diphosphocytidyl-2-C-methyl-D-erythritol kinase
MATVHLPAPAKINLHLEVLGRDSDGYHVLETLFQTLELADQLTISINPGSGITLTCDQDDLPCDHSNLAWRAADAYLAQRPDLGQVTIDLRKTIPAGGGLGGGSSDAATVLRGLARLDPQPLGSEQLHAIAAALGSDVPFFLIGGCAHATGRGERLTALADLPRQPITILAPAVHCSTPAVFQALTDSERGPRTGRGSKHWQQTLVATGLSRAVLHNRLAPAALRRYPQLTTLFDWCDQSGAAWLLSGSGATCFVLGHVAPPAGVRHWHTWTLPRQ